MKNKKSNCCDTQKSDCNTQESNCCSTTGNRTSGNIKKTAGLGVLFLAITFAIFSAFTLDSSDKNVSCSSGEASCEIACDADSEETSCCSKK